MEISAEYRQALLSEPPDELIRTLILVFHDMERMPSDEEVEATLRILEERPDAHLFLSFIQNERYDIEHRGTPRATWTLC